MIADTGQQAFQIINCIQILTDLIPVHTLFAQFLDRVLPFQDRVFID